MIRKRLIKQNRDLKFNCFLFDWDGCLVDTLPIWFEGMHKGLAHFNIKAPEDMIKKGFQGWDIFTQLGVSDMGVFTKQVYRYINDNLCNVKFNEGVISTLIQLKEKGIKSAVVTTTEREKVFSVLDRLNMMDAFDCVIGRNDVKKLKPDREAIDRALALIEGDKTSTAIVGDSEVDILAGQNAGISTIWFSSAENKNFHPHINAQKLNPDFTINRFHELQKFF